MARFIELVRPIQNLLPEVEAPLKKQSFNDKLMWTAWTLFIYLICCQIPLYGMIKTEGADPLYWLRVILASNKGTIMELGMSPIITSGMIMQLLVGAKMLDVNMNSPDDRQLFQSTQKLFGLLITFGEALAYLLSGMYGPVGELGFFRSLIIVAQLFLAGFMVLMLDELLQKGYGLGSGISLFIATNICETVMWKSFSPVTIRTDQGTEFEGAIIAAFHFIMTKPNPMYGIYQAFQRQNAPNLGNLAATVIVMLIVVWFQDFQVKLQLAARKTKGHRQPFPIKLFYTSNIPIILQTAFVSNIYFFTQILATRFRGNFIVGLFGKWQDYDMAGSSQPIGGLAYYISPPQSLYDIQKDPVHAIIYTIFVLSSCGFFSRIWIDISNSSSKDVARQFTENDLILHGQREKSMIKELDRFIPTAAITGGVCIGLLSIFADFLGAIGSGTGILLAVTIISQYFEQIAKESDVGNDAMIF